MDPFTCVTLHRILTPLCKPVQPHKLAAFDWSEARRKRVELAADPEKAVQEAKDEAAKEEAQQKARAAQIEIEAVGDFDL